MSKTEYYSAKKYDVLENKSMIHVFKKTIFGNLKYWRGLATEYYTWEEDEAENGIIFIIREKDKNDANHAVKETGDKDGK